MDTNQETGVSLQDVADLIEQDDDQLAESGEDEGAEEVAQSDESEAPEAEADGAGDDEEVEFEGKSYKVPKELKSALLRQADYTQKTQEVAEQRRAVEERAQRIQQQEAVLGQSFDKAVELRVIQTKLSQFEGIDWQGLADSDPVQATKLNLAYQQLQREAQQKNGELQQAHAQAQQLTEQNRQQMLAEAQKELKQRLPNFTAETAEKIKHAAREYGISDNELNSVIDPRYVHVLHDAAKWRALQADKPKAMQKVAEAPRVMKPQAPTTRSEQNTRAINNRFSSGKARINDLAAFLENS
jgi:hypothetical protein